jgi:hypothetical protein
MKTILVAAIAGVIVALFIINKIDPDSIKSRLKAPPF